MFPRLETVCSACNEPITQTGELLADACKKEKKFNFLPLLARLKFAEQFAL